MMEKASSLAEADDCYFTNQMHNSDTIIGYRYIGRELLLQVNQRIDAFCAGVGAAGMLKGVSQQELRQAYPDVKIVALEPIIGRTR